MKRIVHPPPGPVKQATSKEELDKFLGRKFNLSSFLFDKQLAFVEDPSPFKVAVCSRRSGKTVACVAHLIHEAITKPTSVCLYITLSGNQAKRNVWREVKKLNKKFDLKGKLNEIELSITFSNDSVVYLSGAKDASEIEKFRGLAINLCYIDECQSFREYIKDLIDDVIAPALMDYAGSLCLIGTPGPVPTGYFYKCATGAVKGEEESEESTEFAEWSKHHWTYWENPHIPVTSKMSHQQLFDRELRRKGVTASDPSIRREWYGEWAKDDDSLLIHYDANKNHFQGLIPHVKYEYIMGIDIGYVDADAISILAWSESDPVTYLVEECITTKQGMTELVDQIKMLDAKYKVHKMVMDMGGLGKKMGEEMIIRHSLPIEAADKARKMENIEFLNDALRTGRFKAKAISRFAQDSYLVEIDRDKSTPDRIKVSNRFHSDIIDAVLYAFKFSPAYAYVAPKAKPVIGSKEWAMEQSQEMWEAELEGYKNEIDFNKRLYGDEQ